MAHHFTGAAKFSFECWTWSHGFPNYVLRAAGPYGVSGQLCRPPPRLNYLRVEVPCPAWMRSSRSAEIGDEEFSYSFKAPLANLGR